MKRLALIAIIVGVACKDSVIAVSTVRGSYALQTINTASLPYTITGSNGSQTVVLGDTITLMEGNVFHESGGSRVTANGQTTNPAIFGSGNYSLLGTSMNLNSSIGGVNRTGQIVGNTMTVLDVPNTWVFTKLGN
jgi:TRAP-type C4-dicarboxylate transport system permease large subunit